MILVLARNRDDTADAVIEALNERQAPVCRINPAWFPDKLTLSATLDGGQWSGHLRTPARIVAFEDIDTIWYWSPEAYQIPCGLSPARRKHSFDEAKIGVGGVLASLTARWVNHPSRIADSAYKPLQQVRAWQCGLTVPDTLITNEPEAVESFAAQGRTIRKLMSGNTIVEDGVRHVNWTRVIDDDDLDDLRGIAVTAHQVQRWVRKAAEARVIVIGDHVTSVEISAGSDSAYIDWRSDYPALSYRLIDAPPDVVDGIRALMRSLGLVYGALDFVITPDGHWVFLEINASGRFRWLEAESGVNVPLTAMFAEFLAGHAEDTPPASLCLGEQPHPAPGDNA
ncbi:RimK domain-containing protein [Saccharopolyspora sp. K220]|uniref:MvdC/MvdD family ATP grasp protein n=1 Tax=Saccharopolyspora soli TaxID=2926618 RepID=UPI001F59D5DD|nr:RimK domain-containing protein [Saccharopolyspora soli]MCI2422894.1 RimK domain-containing protein [Saccharopolyspora soli]